MPVRSAGRTISATPPALNFVDAHVMMRTLTEHWDGKLTVRLLRAAPLPQLAENAIHDTNAIDASKESMTFNLSTPLPPSAWGPILFLPGLTIRDISLGSTTTTNSVGTLTWTVTGHVYTR
jgi:hypothetical protein